MLGKCETCGTSFKNRRLRQSKSKGEEVQILKWCDKCWADRRRQKSEAVKPKKPSNDEEGGAVGDAATSTVFFGASSLTFSSRSRPLGGHGAPGDWVSSTGSAIVPQAPAQRSPETPMFRTPMSSPAARPATPADDGWRLDTNTPARPPPARRQVRILFSARAK